MDADTIYSIIFDETIKLYQRLERLSLLEGIRDENNWQIECKKQSVFYLFISLKCE